MTETFALALALAGGLTWALVICLDALLVKDIYRHPFQALFVTGLLGAWGFLILPFVEWQWPTSSSAAWLALAGGLALAASYWCYFLAMDMGEAEEIAIWDAAHPLLIAFLSIPLGLQLTGQNWLGVLVIIGSIIAFSCHKGIKADASIHNVTKYRALLFSNASLMAFTYLLMGLAIQAEAAAVGNSDVYWNLYPYYLGGTCTAALVIFWPPVWRAMAADWLMLIQPRMLGTLFIMEVCNVIAPLLITLAMTASHPAIAAALGTTFPIWIVLMSPMFRALGGSEEAFPHVEPKDKLIKICIIGVLCVGIALLYGASAVDW